MYTNDSSQLLTLEGPFIHDCDSIRHHICLSSVVLNIFDQIKRNIIEGKPVVRHFARHHDILRYGNTLFKPFLVAPDDRNENGENEIVIDCNVSYLPLELTQETFHTVNVTHLGIASIQVIESAGDTLCLQHDKLFRCPWDLQ